MSDKDAQIKALDLILFYLQNQNVTDDLQMQGLKPDDIERVQNAYMEFVDDVKASMRLWRGKDEN